MKRQKLDLRDMLEFTPTQEKIPVDHFWNRVQRSCESLPSELFEEKSVVRQNVSTYLLKLQDTSDSENDSEEEEKYTLNGRIKYERIYQVFRQNGYSTDISSSYDFEECPSTTHLYTHKKQTLSDAGFLDTKGKQVSPPPKKEKEGKEKYKPQKNLFQRAMKAMPDRNMHRPDEGAN